jgi:hypothetical protein
MDKKRIRETKAIEPQQWQRGILIPYESLTNWLKYDIMQCYEKEDTSKEKEKSRSSKSKNTTISFKSKDIKEDIREK